MKQVSEDPNGYGEEGAWREDLEPKEWHDGEFLGFSFASLSQSSSPSRSMGTEQKSLLP